MLDWNVVTDKMLQWGMWKAISLVVIIFSTSAKCHHWQKRWCVCLWCKWNNLWCC